MPAPIDRYAGQIESINLELAQIFHCPPARLELGAERTMEDALVVCGIMGGKDVGKSTLINALAGAKVSVDEDEAGEGTSKPQVYVHADSVAQVQARFGTAHLWRSSPSAAETAFVADWHQHRADPIRNVVLIDLPDFDSEFPHHFQIVEEAAPHLDRVLWILTPRKVADRAWTNLLRHVAKDHVNIYYVLNKMDEIVAEDFRGNGRTPQGTRPSNSNQYEAAADAAPQLVAEFWRSQLDWFQTLLRRGSEPPKDERLFLLSAEYNDVPKLTNRIAQVWDDPQWNLYAAERPAVQWLARRLAEELDRLRRNVLAPVSPDEAWALKEANCAAEIEHARRQLRAHYQLDHWCTVLEQACAVEYQQSLVNDVFGADFCRDAADRLAARLRSPHQLANELFDWRVQRWPLLRVLYHPLGGLAGSLGRRLAGFIPTVPSFPDADRDRGAGVHDHRTVADRCDALRDRLMSEHAHLLKRFELHGRTAEVAPFAERFATRCDRLREELDRCDLEILKQQSRPPGWSARLMLWAVLLWFPLLQPVAEGALEVLSGGGVVSTAHGAYKLVWALGAAQLLKGLILVLAVYLVCLTAIYARCVRDARAVRGHPAPSITPRDAGAAELAGEIDRALLEEVVGPLVQPLLSVRSVLAGVNERLSRLTA